MNQLKLFIDLTRLKKPIGFMLLFWPCAWGVNIAYDLNENIIKYIFFLTLFFLGAVLMRSAGCIVNDIFDKDFDSKVFRTKNRPVASGKISINVAVIYSLILCFLALLILLNFNYLTIILALGSMPLAFSYPLMKRYTYWPQLFLGITFNYGIILGWTAVKEEIEIIPVIFYFGAIFWTLGYDSIYGYQDIKDDEIIGLKSTSIKFKKNPKTFLTLCYSIFFTILILTGLILNYNIFYFIGLILVFIQLFYYQLKKINIESSEDCLKKFKSNNYLGLLVFFILIIGKI